MLEDVSANSKNTTNCNDSTSIASNDQENNVNVKKDVTQHVVSDNYNKNLILSDKKDKGINSPNDRSLTQCKYRGNYDMDKDIIKVGNKRGSMKLEFNDRVLDYDRSKLRESVTA